MVARYRFCSAYIKLTRIPQRVSLTDIPSELEPNRPKRPKTGGRQKGSLNKATRDIKALAQPYGPEALETLVEIMRKGETDAVRKGAADSLLDRGFGKPAQAMEHSGPEGGPIRMLNEIDRAARIAGLLGRAVKRKEDA